MVYHSFPNVCGLWPTHTNPGYHLLNYSIMDLSRTLIYDGNVLSQIMVPSFLQLAHVEKSNLVCHFFIGKTKRLENIIKPVVIHDVIESKWITFRHQWCRCGPPVLMNLNSNPACHVEPTTNPLYKLLKIHWHIQPLVSIRNEDLFRIALFEHNQKQLNQRHTKYGVMKIMSERSEIILKVAGFLGTNNTLYPPINSASISINLSRDILCFWIYIIVNSNPLTAKLRHVFRM